MEGEHENIACKDSEGPPQLSSSVLLQPHLVLPGFQADSCSLPLFDAAFSLKTWQNSLEGEF